MSHNLQRKKQRLSSDIKESKQQEVYWAARFAALKVILHQEWHIRQIWFALCVHWNQVWLHIWKKRKPLNMEGFHFNAHKPSPEHREWLKRISRPESFSPTSPSWALSFHAPAITPDRKKEKEARRSNRSYLWFDSACVEVAPLEFPPQRFALHVVGHSPQRTLGNAIYFLAASTAIIKKGGGCLLKRGTLPDSSS